VFHLFHYLISFFARLWIYTDIKMKVDMMRTITVKATHYLPETVTSGRVYCYYLAFTFS